jgi:hypothetical protein
VCPKEVADTEVDNSCCHRFPVVIRHFDAPVTSPDDRKGEITKCHPSEILACRRLFLFFLLLLAMSPLPF